MKAFIEITEWDVDYTVPGHTYFVSDSKDKLFAYIKCGSDKIEEFKKPYRFGTTGRKFREVNNTWGFFPREELIHIGETFKIPGSKGAVHTVTEHLGQWSCSCAGFKFRGQCRHIDVAKQ